MGFPPRHLPAPGAPVRLHCPMGEAAGCVRAPVQELDVAHTPRLARCAKLIRAASVGSCMGFGRLGSSMVDASQTAGPGNGHRVGAVSPIVHWEADSAREVVRSSGPHRCLLFWDASEGCVPLLGVQ